MLTKLFAITNKKVATHANELLIVYQIRLSDIGWFALLFWKSKTFASISDKLMGRCRNKTHYFTNKEMRVRTNWTLSQ